MENLAQVSISSESKRRLFVGCLESYNSGIIHGEWLDLSDYYDIEELQDKVNAILKSGPCQGEEYDIQDYEGFGDLLKGEYYPNLSKAWEIHETLLQVEEAGIDEELFLEFLSSHCYGEDISEKLIERFQDSYQGCFNSLEDYGQDCMENCGYLSDLPKNIILYFDYERFAKDMELSGDIFTIELGYRQIHVFSNYY